MSDAAYVPDGPYTIELDFDGTLIRWSSMYAQDRTFRLRMNDETVRRHRERIEAFDREFVPNCDTEGL